MDVEYLGTVGTEDLSGCQQDRRFQGHSIGCSFPPTHITDILNLLSLVASQNLGRGVVNLVAKSEEGMILLRKMDTLNMNKN